MARLLTAASGMSTGLCMPAREALPTVRSMALGRASRNVGQRDSEVVILCPLAGWFPGRQSAGAGLPQSYGRVRAAVKTMAAP